MTISRMQRQAIEELALDQKGLFAPDVPPTETPTLLVGLGGLGLRTLNRVKAAVVRDFQPSRHLFFLGIDGDLHDLQNMRRETGNGGWLEEQEIISLHCPDMHLDGGAGGYRREGHEMLLRSHGAEQLRAKMLQIVHEAWNYNSGLHLPQKMEILLVTGIGGGTGGGILNDTAYLIHDALQFLPGMAYRLRACLYLPDVFYPLPRYGGQWDLLCKSGYAALRELNYYMRLPEHRGSYRMRFGAFEVVSNRRVFDACTLMGGRNCRGEYRTLEESVAMMSDHLTDLLAGGHMTPGCPPLATVFSEDRRPEFLHWLHAAHPAGELFPMTADYSYQTLTYSSVVLPGKEILTWFAGQVFRAVLDEWRQPVYRLEGEIQQMMQAVGIAHPHQLMQNVWAMAEAQFHIRRLQLPDIEYPDRAELRMNPYAGLERAMDYARHIMGRLPREAVAGYMAEELYRRIRGQLWHYCGQKGPYAVTEMLEPRLSRYAGPDRQVPGVLERIEEMIHFSAEALQRNSEEFRRRREAEIPEAAQYASSVLGGRQRVARYMDVCCEIAEIQAIRMPLLQAQYDALLRLRNRLHRDMEETWTTFDEILDTVGDVLGRDANDITLGNRPEHHFRYRTELVDLRGADPESERLRETLSHMITPLLIQLVANRLSHSMQNYSQMWLERDQRQNFKADQVIRDITEVMLNTQFGDHWEEKLLLAAFHPMTLDRGSLDTIYALHGAEWQQAMQLAVNKAQWAFAQRTDDMLHLETEYTFSMFRSLDCRIDSARLPEVSMGLDAALPPAAIHGQEVGRLQVTACTLRYLLPLFAADRMSEYSHWGRDARGITALYAADSRIDWERIEAPYPLDCAARRRERLTDYADYERLMEVKTAVDDGLERGYIVRKPGEEYYTLCCRTEQIPLFLPDTGLDALDLEGLGRPLPIGDLYKLVHSSEYLTNAVLEAYRRRMQEQGEAADTQS